MSRNKSTRNKSQFINKPPAPPQPETIASKYIKQLYDNEIIVVEGGLLREFGLDRPSFEVEEKIENGLKFIIYREDYDNNYISRVRKVMDEAMVSYQITQAEQIIITVRKNA